MNPFKILVFILCFATSVNAQTGIGTSTPDASAKLEVSSSNKGFLPPRVSLTSITDTTTILSPATGLLVYCKGDAGLSPGYYFWNGSAWAIIATSDGNKLTDIADPINAQDVATKAYVDQSVNILYPTENMALDGTQSPTVSTSVLGRNSSFGYLSLKSITTGYDNSAFGWKSLNKLQDGNNNIAIGGATLFNTTSGSSNIAIGGNSVQSNTTGNFNIGIGKSALTRNTTSNDNIGIGNSSLNDNLIGTMNVMIGNKSGFKNLADGNTGIGFRVLELNTSGNYNLGAGWDALRRTTGTGNVGIGYKSGWFNVSGVYNTFIGYNAGVVDGDTNLSNATAIGANAIVTTNNTIQLGADGTNGTIAIENVKTSGAITAASFKTLSGSSSEFLKADGTLDTNTYLTAAGTATNVSGVVAVANGGTGVTTATGNGNAVLSNGPTIEMPVISSGSGQFPSSLIINPTTHATSKRAGIWMGNWGLLQDFDGDGTKNFSITQNFSGTYPTRFFISTNGNVGIGNSAPTETLEVTGNVKATNFIGTASSALSAPTNINYYSTTIAPVLNIENGNYIDLINFTLPSAGTYKITYIIRNYVSLSNTTGLVFLRESSNAQVPDSVLMPQYGKSDNQAVGTQIVFLTIDASKTYKLTAWTQPGTGAQHILNDGNGYSKLIWEKIQ